MTEAETLSAEDLTTEQFFSRMVAFIESNYHEQARSVLEAAIDKAVLDEREACALTAEGWPSGINSQWMKPFSHDADVAQAVARRDLAIAKAIRNRSKGGA